jgi:hypothetical protein
MAQHQQRYQQKGNDVIQPRARIKTKEPLIQKSISSEEQEEH